MDKRKPTIDEIRQYLKKYNPFGLGDAEISLINEHNHLNYRLDKDDKAYCLRMINPETYRAGEWLEIAEEHVILKYLEKSGFGPKSYYVDPERFIIPLMIQEFISGAICFNDLKPFSEKHLMAVAQAIALLNSQNITPDVFAFRERFTRYSYLTSIKTWLSRLTKIKESSQRDVLDWAKRIEEVVFQSKKILEHFEPLLREAEMVFNFDGAHSGNTYWLKDRVIFLDWQKVSFGDPAFTLARFLTSIGKDGEILEKDRELMLNVYLKERPVPNFAQLFNQRIFERQVADLVWVLWHYVKEQRSEPVTSATSVVARYRQVEKTLQEY